MNSVKLFGRLGNDPEQKTFSNGGSIVTFNLATDDSYYDKEGQRQPRTQWHRIVAGGRTGETCLRYLRKGRQVLIDGSIYYRHWTGEDGREIWSTEIRAFRVEFGDSRPGGDMPQAQDQQRQDGGAPQHQGQPAQRPAVQPEEDYGIPAGGMSDVPF